MDKRDRTYDLFIDPIDTLIFGPQDQIFTQSISLSQILISDPLTIEFDVSKRTLSSASTASFRVYNLSENVRNKIYKDPTEFHKYKQVHLKAGYGAHKSTVFKGNIKQAGSVREGNNFITHIECYDGGFSYNNANTSTPFPKETPRAVVIESMIKDLSKTNVSRGVVGDFTESSKRGSAYSGNTASLLTEVTGGAFFIDDEKAYCLGDNECVLGDIPIITSDSGLLGTPKKEGPKITFDILFEPRLKMGQLLRLKSSTNKIVNDDYKIVGLHHRGIISGSVNGPCVTSVELWKGTALLKVVT